jgi:hypothetical protein
MVPLEQLEDLSVLPRFHMEDSSLWGQDLELLLGIFLDLSPVWSYAKR